MAEILPLSNNYLALGITFVLSLAWLRLMDFIAHRGWVNSRASRKIIHIGTGPLFVICWLLFNNQPEARWLAALVPIAITVQFALVGLGMIRDDPAVQAMSRTGDRREILRGPLFYGIVFIAITLIFWKESPVGIIALMLVCGGDGLADVIGRHYGQKRLPWSPEKSYAGSLGVFFGGAILAIVILAIYVAMDVFSGPLHNYLPAVSIIALAAALVESLPYKDIDNLTVAITAVLVGMIVF